MMVLSFFIFFENKVICQTNKSTKTKVEKTNFDIERKDFLLKINQLRASGCNCGSSKMKPVLAVTFNARLDSSARVYARDMFKNKKMSHVGSDKSKFSERITKAGYKWKFSGENIARGQLSAAEVFEDWKISPSHCLNMMSGDYKEIGLARVGDFWALDFGTKF